MPYVYITFDCTLVLVASLLCSPKREIFSGLALFGEEYVPALISWPALLKVVFFAVHIEAREKFKVSPSLFLPGGLCHNFSPHYGTLFCGGEKNAENNLVQRCSKDSIQFFQGAAFLPGLRVSATKKNCWTCSLRMPLG